MGLFTSKIAMGVLAGGFTLGAAGLLFTGTETLEDAKRFVTEAGQKITQYELNEQSLIGKFNLLKSNTDRELTAANSTIEQKKAEIEQKTAQITALNETKTKLESSLATLQTEIAAIEEQLDQANGNNTELQRLLDEKTAAYNSVHNQLIGANKRIGDLEGLLRYANEKAKEADGHVAQLEREVQKANAEVEVMGNKVEEVKAQTQDKAPLPQGEIDNLETNVPEATK